MVLSTRMRIVAAALLLPLSCTGAELAATPSGRWAGAIHAPSGDVKVAVDLARGADGEWVGTFTSSAEHLTGYPLWRAGVDGRSIKLEIKTGGGGVQAFAGNISSDGQTITGDFLVSVYAVPFTLTRTGDAQIAPLPYSPAIGKTLEGQWTASLDIGGKALPIALTMANHTDGTASGSWALADGVATPVTIAHQGRSVTLESTVAPASYAGVVSADGTEISGTFNDGNAGRAVVFTRAAALH